MRFVRLSGDFTQNENEKLSSSRYIDSTPSTASFTPTRLYTFSTLLSTIFHPPTTRKISEEEKWFPLFFKVGEFGS
jgi:hypothetical protein